MTGPRRTYQNLWGSTFPTTQQGTSQALGWCANHFLNVTADGYLLGMRYFRSPSSPALPALGFLIDSFQGTLTIVRACVFKTYPSWLSPPTGRWESAYWKPRYKVTAPKLLRIGIVAAVNFRWWYTPGVLATVDFVNGPLTLPHTTSSQPNVMMTTASNTYLMLPAINNVHAGDMYGMDVTYWDGQS